jgi:hypothetical protein
MRYQDFIAELRTLIAAGGHLAQGSASHESPAFRNWRHNVQSLVAEAEQLGYRLPGKVTSKVRSYRALWSGATEKDHADAFQRELNDSLIELRFIVDNYDKYGEAVRTQLVGPEQQPAALGEPEKVTIIWLAKNVSVSFWFKTASIAVAILLLGAALGHTAWFGTLVKWVKHSLP